MSAACCEVEQRALKMKGPGAGGRADLTPYPIQAAARTVLYVPKKEPKGKKDIKAGGNVGQVQASACAGCTGAACL